MAATVRGGADAIVTSNVGGFPSEACEPYDVDVQTPDEFLRLEIIGEAIGRIARLDPESVSRISEHRQIVAFRNRLIHGYDLLDDELVWSTVETEVPVLLLEVESLLGQKGA